MIVGVTGPTGSGKSLFSKYLKEKGFHVLDADVIVKNLYKENKFLVGDIEREFSFAVEGGVVNKLKLSNFVFSNRCALLKLSKIVNPYVLRHIYSVIKKGNFKHIAIDAPTLFESGADVFCNFKVVILSNLKIRLNRIIARDKISRHAALKRIASQPSNSFYVDRGNIILQNCGDVNILRGGFFNVFSSAAKKN